MRWRFWAVLAAALFAVGGAVAGTLIATGLGGSDVARPRGAQSVLRIEPVDNEVSCGLGGAAVYIYLDDLARRPSALDANVSAGVIGFEFPLRYDPDVLQIGEPINVQLNPQLDLEDSDRDGVVRSFIPVSYINDGEGWALLGAASFNPSSQGRPGENQEEGLDPAAKGEPILLMTVRFQTVGEGTSAITIEPVVTSPGYPPDEARLYDPGLGRYEPVAIKGSSVTVAGGDCSAVARSTPLPTPRPTSTPYVPPTPTPVVWSTVTPEAPSAVGRSDCPQGWVVYSDPQDRFSICYPADLSATASDFAVNVDKLPAAGQRGGGFTVAVSWTAVSNYSVIGKPSPETCPQYSVMGQTSSEFVELSLTGRVVPACLNQGVLEGAAALEIVSLKGEIPVAEDGSGREGFIELYVGYVDSEVRQVPTLAESVLTTLLVNFRCLENGSRD